MHVHRWRKQHSPIIQLGKTFFRPLRHGGSVRIYSNVFVRIYSNVFAWTSLLRAICVSGVCEKKACDRMYSCTSPLPPRPPISMLSFLLVLWVCEKKACSSKPGSKTNVHNIEIGVGGVACRHLVKSAQAFISQTPGGYWFQDILSRCFVLFLVAVASCCIACVYV